MLNEEMGKKIAELAENEEAVKAFGATKTVQERVVVLKQYGIDVAESELAVCEAMFENSKDGELSEEALSAVSGGFLVSIAAVTLVATMYATALGGTYATYKIFERK